MKRFLKVFAQILFLVCVVALIIMGVDNRIIVTAADAEVTSMTNAQEPIDQTEHSALNSENVETEENVKQNEVLDEPQIESSTKFDPEPTASSTPVSNPTPTPAPSVEPVKPAISFTDVDEYLYVNAGALNVRVGPGVEYDAISSITVNTQVHRIGVSDNGWSKLDYNGQNAYVSSAYLSYEQIVINTDVQDEKSESTYVEEAAKETVAEEMARRGNIGRLTIPSVGVDVALFNASLYGGASWYVDQYDSAAYMADAQVYCNQALIADHDNHGFYLMKGSVPNQTYAYIDFGTHVVTYLCTNKIIGYNTGSDLTDISGLSLRNYNGSDICMYTCNTDGTITITFWQQI